MKSHMKPRLQEPESSASGLMDVYIRNNKKQALLVHIRRQTHLQLITRAIATHFAIPAENQVLFSAGQQLANAPQALQHQAIIHVVDTRGVTPQITITVRRLTLPTAQQFTVSSSELIEDFIVRHIREEEAEKLFLVQAGRQLNRSRSFAEELVEGGSELFCLHEDRDQVRGQRRQNYLRRINQEEAAQKEQHPTHPQTHSLPQESHSGLENYLPKPRPAQGQAQPIGNHPSTAHGLRPDFKKKNTTKEVILSSNQPNLRHIPSEDNLRQIPSEDNLRHISSEDNLSLMTENNFHQGSKSNANSGFFHEGSSISEIIPEQSHNPQNNKRNEEASIFQSAFIGLTYDSIIATQSQVQCKIGPLTPAQQQESSQHSELNSFSFDARAPELMQALPPDRHLTLIEREILEVTESQELSKENLQQVNQIKDLADQLSEERSGERQEERSGERQEERPGERQEERQQERQEEIQEQRQRDKPNDSSQFELGQIDNHELSKSAEMKVALNQKQSPLRVFAKNHEILIEDEENNQDQRQQQPEDEGSLKAIAEDLRLEEETSNFSAKQQAKHRTRLGELAAKSQGQESRREAKQQQTKQEIKLQDYQNSCFQEFPQENIDIYFIQQGNEAQEDQQGVSEAQAEEKNECQTNGPSSNSNFYSKNSSRVKQPAFLANEYQFGDHHKPFNFSARRSGYVPSKSPEDQELLFDNSNSQNNSKHQALEQQRNIGQLEKRGSSKEEQWLQILQLPRQLRINQHSSLLPDQYNEVPVWGLDVEPGAEVAPGAEVEAGKQAKQAEKSKLFPKKGSNIDVLSNLLSELQEQKNNDNQQLLIQDSGLRDLQAQKIFQPKGEPGIKIDFSGCYSGSGRCKDGSKKEENEVREEKEEREDREELEDSYVQRVEIKKNIASQQSDTNLLDYGVKQNIHKEIFAAGQLVFRSQPSYFDPLEFYITLFEKEILSSNQPST